MEPPRPRFNPVARPASSASIRAGSLGQDVPVAAVGAGDQVVRAQRRAHPDRDSFLPDIGVRAADYLARFDQFECP
jgi:hypothetical protein